jgi:hypothetical protein
MTGDYAMVVSYIDTFEDRLPWLDCRPEGLFLGPRGFEVSNPKPLLNGRHGDLMTLEIISGGVKKHVDFPANTGDGCQFLTSFQFGAGKNCKNHNFKS